MRAHDGSRPLVAHIVGARPNFVKAAPVIRALESRGADRVLIHTGQHYDDAMSGVFFRELDLPDPDVNLGVGSGSSAEQTAALLVGLEREYLDRRPDAVVVYGDVNSTLAGALVAARLGIPVVHVEAGLRSFDDTMPEEINRRLTDQLADLLLTTSPEAADHLRAEGRPADRVHFVGNTMIDTLEAHRAHLDPSALRGRFDLPERWAVVTFHRPVNVDTDAAAGAISTAIEQLSHEVDVVMPLHPRSRDRLTGLGLGTGPRVHLIDPLGYRDFLSLVSGAALVVTDSGGVQEETTMLGIPCLTARTTTERPITISHGTNALVAIHGIVDAARAVLRGDRVLPAGRPPLWDGHAAERAAAVILDHLSAKPGAVR